MFISLRAQLTINNNLVHSDAVKAFNVIFTKHLNIKRPLKYHCNKLITNLYDPL